MPRVHVSLDVWQESHDQMDRVVKDERTPGVLITHPSPDRPGLNESAGDRGIVPTPFEETRFFERN